MAFSVPAVKGIEFGTGFGFADLKGIEANDAFRMQGGRIVTATNHNAGLNGGISNGMPVVFRTVVKPTPSIYKPQDTVDYIAKQNAELSIQGRHDPCIVPRAAIVQTCAAALAVGDLLTAKYGMAGWNSPPLTARRSCKWNTDSLAPNWGTRTRRSSTRCSAATGTTCARCPPRRRRGPS